MIRQKSTWLMLALAMISGFCFLNFSWSELSAYQAGTYVYKVLDDLGNPKPAGFPENITDEMVKRGREMVFNGHTEKPDGGRSKYISVYYVCTNCHNTVIEDPVLTDMMPGPRLAYAKEHQLPFLQGTTFYGAVNRETWYNDDYYKKYGDLVKPANHDIREAIQLCAQECSKGRKLDAWEIESILAYYYSISYKLGDILNENEIEQLNKKTANSSNHTQLISWIKSKYALKSPATFVEPPYDQPANLSEGNAENGKAIYELSCQTCHKPYGCSDVVFDDSKFTFHQLSNDFDKNYWWLFETIRHGKNSYPGHEPYMPHYTAERMSDQQIQDLKTYLEAAAAGN